MAPANLDLFNQIAVASGGEGGHPFNIDALNEIASQLIGEPQTFTFNIDALNAIAENVSGEPQEFTFIIDALNFISGELSGDSDTDTTTVGALTEWMESSGGVTLDEDAALQIARIETDGGQVEDEQFLSDFIADLKDGGAAGDCYALLDALWIPVASKIDGARKISRLYDLAPSKSGSYYDANQVTAISQQLLTSAAGGIDGKAVMECVATAGGYTATLTNGAAAPATVFAVSIRTATGTDQSILQIATSGTTGPLLRYAVADAIAYGAGTPVSVTTASTTIGRFTARFDGASSSMRRGGTQIHAGTVNSAIPASSQYFVGVNRLGNERLTGKIAAILVVRQSLTTTQRDRIESVMETHFQSAT